MEFRLILFNSLREKILQEATAKNQEFQNTCKSLDSFLENLPTDEINSNDDMSQVSKKQSSQEVRLSTSQSTMKTKILLFSLPVSDLFIHDFPSVKLYEKAIIMLLITH